MNLRDKIPHSTAALLGTNLALAAILLFGWLVPPEPSPSEVPATAEAAGVALPELATADYAAPRLDELTAMLERPLFFEDRRMPAPPEAPAPDPPAKPLRLKLEGIAIVGDSRIAVVRDTAKNTLLQLAEGMTHEDWTLESVTASMARFSRGQQHSDLRLNPEPPAGR